MNALGVDPGLSGALAIVEFIGGIPVLVDTIDMPSTGTGAKARVDIIAAASWIAKHAPSTAYVERAQAFPGQGKQWIFPRSERWCHRGGSRALPDTDDLGRRLRMEAAAASSGQR